MEQLPKIVRNRLPGVAASAHPDADLLTAFVEGSVSEHERRQVAAHLVSCPECRQIVALAIPEPASVAATPVREPMKPWLRWQVLRWAAVAACLVVVGAAVVIGFRPSAKNTRAVGTYVTSDKQPSAPAVENQVIVSDAKTTGNKQDDAGLAAKAEVAKRDNTLGRARKPSISTNSTLAARGKKFSEPAEAKDKKQLESFAYDAGTGNGSATRPEAKEADKLSSASGVPSAAAPSPPAAPMVGGAVVVPQNAPIVTNRVAGNDSAAAGARLDRWQKTTQPAPAQAKAASSAEVANHALLETAASAPAGLMPDLKAPKWSLSEDGLPQRSFDSGATWEKVQVDHRSGFRALSAAGVDVWVGGRGGLLYHSADMGLHWVRIIPVSNESTLAADITRIDFADPLHGNVTTADGETWNTSNGGNTWHRQ